MSCLPAKHISELATPALLLNMRAMEGNLARMKAFFDETPAKLRPHYKNLKCPALAKKQLAAGAIGITCATIREAQALVRHGVTDILLATEIAGPIKIREFVGLSREAKIIVGVDHVDSVRCLAQASRESGVPLSVVVDIDVGLGRCGVGPGEAALKLTRSVIDNGLVFRGLMGYEGRILQPPGPEKTALCNASMQKLVDTRRLLEANGIFVEIVSAGGTGNYSVAGQYQGVTEIQAGSFMVMDTDYSSVCFDFEPVLTVLTTVISRTGNERLILDAGLKSLSTERGLPTLKEQPEARLRKLSGEHGTVDILAPSLPARIGDTMEIWVHYADATVNLHDRIYGVRGEFIEECFYVER